MPRSDFHVFAPIHVRWGDMDSYGHVNNSVYFTYYEEARLKYFSSVGIGDHAGHPDHRPALVTATINFRKQVHWPPHLESAVRVVKIGRSSFTFEHALFAAGTEEVFADGSSVVALVDYSIPKSIPLPDQLRDAIRKLDHLD